MYSSIETNLDTSSDHSPIIITLSNYVIWKEPPPQLSNRSTNWIQFQDYISDNITLNLRLKENQDLEDAVDYITKLIQTASWISTPERKKTTQEAHYVPMHIRPRPKHSLPNSAATPQLTPKLDATMENQSKSGKIRPNNIYCKKSCLPAS
jgi:hypothetical protein